MVHGERGPCLRYVERFFVVFRSVQRWCARRARGDLVVAENLDLHRPPTSPRTSSHGEHRKDVGEARGGAGVEDHPSHRQLGPGRPPRDWRQELPQLLLEPLPRLCRRAAAQKGCAGGDREVRPRNRLSHPLGHLRPASSSTRRSPSSKAPRRPPAFFGYAANASAVQTLLDKNDIVVSTS